MKRSGGAYRIGTGATSLMMVLVILTLTALSVVSYTSARSELMVSRRAAQVHTQVYAAMSQGYDRLAALDAALLQLRNETDAAAYAAEAQAAAQAQGWQTSVPGTLTCHIPATERLFLEVQALLTPYEEASARLKVTSFAAVTGGEEMEGSH